jgi:transposase
MDLGDRTSALCLVSADGDIVEEAQLRTSTPALSARFAAMPPTRVVMEVGTHSRWVSRLLTSFGHEVIVASAVHLRPIAESLNKSDRIDARTLALCGRMPQLLKAVHHRPAEVQAALAVLRSRHILIRARTTLINHVRGMVKSEGARIRSCDSRTFHRHAHACLPDLLRPALEPVLDEIAALTARINAMDREVERLITERFPEARGLQQVNGVGPITALTFVVTLSEPARFPTSRAVGAYLGLAPRQRQSGASRPQLGITKQGDRQLRVLLIEAAHYILGPRGKECDLRTWGLKRCELGGGNAKKRAVVAVARKLAVLLHHLWQTGEVYEPIRVKEVAA